MATSWVELLDAMEREGCAGWWKLGRQRHPKSRLQHASQPPHLARRHRLLAQLLVGVAASSAQVLMAGVGGARSALHPE